MSLFWFSLSCLILIIIVMTIVFWSSLSHFLVSLLPSLLSSSTCQEKIFQEKNSEFSVNNNQLMAINVANFKDRIAELEQDFTDNTITENQFSNQKLELQRQLIQAETAEQNSSSAKNRVNAHSNNQLTRITKLGISVCVIMLTVTAYFLIESREITHQHWINQQKYSQVADELLIGKIDAPPDWSIDTPFARHALLTAMKSNLHAHTNNANPKKQQQNSQRWLRMSQLLLTMKQTDSALIAMERAVKLENDYTSPNYAKLATSYAKSSYFENGEIMPAKAEKILKTLITHQPEHKGAVILLVMSETRKGNHQKALALVDNLRTNIEKGADSANKAKVLASLTVLISSIKNNQQSMTESMAEPIND